MHQYSLSIGVLRNMFLIAICAYNLGALGYRARQASHINNSVLLRSTRSSKDITFIRHAESYGNLLGKKPWQYVIETGSSLMYAWKDGRITDEGKQYIQKRVMTEFDDSLLDRIFKAEVVYVSPLIRAMETLIIVLSTAVRRKGMNFRLFDSKKFVVTADLREKMGSQSDKPGASGVDVADALRQVALEQADLHPGSSPAHYQKLAETLTASYQEELLRTSSFSEDPDDAEKILKSIERFRADLDSISEKRVLIVGHSGWSRWNFAAGMQGPCVPPGTAGWADIAFGGRQVGELKNIGVLTAKFSRRQFHDVEVFGGELCPKKSKFGAFASIEEAKEAGFIPQDAIVHHMHVRKKMDHVGFKGRWLTFSASKGFSSLAWSNTMGEPRKYVDLVQAANRGGMRYACDKANQAVLLDVTNAPIVWDESKQRYTWVHPFSFRIKATGEDNWTDFHELCFLVRVHVKFGTDVGFIRTLFQEMGWDNGMKELDLEAKIEELEAQWQTKHPDVLIPPETSDGEDLDKLRYDIGLPSEKYDDYDEISDSISDSALWASSSW